MPFSSWRLAIPDPLLVRDVPVFRDMGVTDGFKARAGGEKDKVRRGKDKPQTS